MTESSALNLSQATGGSSRPDETGYNAHYKEQQTGFESVFSAAEYASLFEQRFMTPFCEGGWVFDGDVLQFLVGRLDEFTSGLGKKRSDVCVLDAGCGIGRSSVYLASKGYRVIGVEISQEGAKTASALAQQVGIDNCDFRAASLENTGLPSSSVDVFYGRNTLHHFIKYPLVAAEFRRIAKPGAIGLFMDPFGENVFKNIFHDEEKMGRLGDVLLTKKGIQGFFSDEEIHLYPFKWFSMLDKLLIKHLFGWKKATRVRKFSGIYSRLDRKIPGNNRLALWLSGMVVTEIRY